MNIFKDKYLFTFFMITILVVVGVKCKATSTYSLGVTDNDEYYASANIISMFSNYNSTSIAYNSTEKSIKLTASATSSDPGVFFNCKSKSLSANSYKYVVITYKTTKSTTTRVFWQTAGTPNPDGNFLSSYKTQNDNKYHSKIIDLSANSSWTGTIHGFRFDYFDSANANEYMYIDSIVFCKTQADADYIKWERESVRNTPGVFLASEEMVRLFDSFHMCSAKYDSEEKAIALTVESNVCATGMSSHVAGAYKCAPGFDCSARFSLPAGGSFGQKYVVFTYMTPNEIESTVGTDGYGNVLQDISEFGGGAPVVIYPTDSTSTETQSYHRNFIIYEPNIFYSTVIDLTDSDTQLGTFKTIRIDPFSYHYARPGCVLYISSIILCDTLDEVYEIAKEQMANKYLYSYKLDYDSNVIDDSVTSMPKNESVVHSQNDFYAYNITERNSSKTRLYI